MKTGAVVMIDALGFKGIWSRVADPQAVMEKLQALKDAVEKRTQPEIGVELTGVTFLSDTIVIGISMFGPSIANVQEMSAILVAGMRTSAVMTVALETKPILVYRGCISFGQFEMNGPFLLGPAVDEAASYMGLAEGAFVWLTPSALKMCIGVGNGNIAPYPFIPYQVPLKGGSVYETWVVAPIRDLLILSKRDKKRIAETLLSSFDNSNALDIQVKRQNTSKFLELVVARELGGRRKKSGDASR